MVLAQLEIPIETVVHLAEVCSREGIPLMLDPAPAVTLPRKLLEKCNVVHTQRNRGSVLSSRARSFGSAKSPSEIATALKSAGLHGIILKLGSRGAFLAQRKQRKRKWHPSP